MAEETTKDTKKAAKDTTTDTANDTVNTPVVDETASSWKQPSASEIEAFKAKHGDVFSMSATGQDGVKRVVYMRKPKYTDLQRAKASENKKALTFNLSIYENCKLAGDPAIDSDDYLRNGILGQLDEIIEMADVEVKKL